LAVPAPPRELATIYAKVHPSSTLSSLQAKVVVGISGNALFSSRDCDELCAQTIVNPDLHPATAV